MSKYETTQPPAIPLDLIEWRPDGKPTNTEPPRCRYVPYIDARHAAVCLDEWVGPFNWRDSYGDGPPMGSGSLWCMVEIRDPDTGEWIGKRDVGKASQFEAEKGLVSDAFKRACVKWGVARNVYELPQQWAICKVGAADRGGNRKVFKHPDAESEITKRLRSEGFDVDRVQVGGADSESSALTREEKPEVSLDATATVSKKKPAKKKAAKKKKAVAKPKELVDELESASGEGSYDIHHRGKVAELRNRANTLDDKGRVVFTQALMTHEVSKADLKAGRVSEDQLAALWKTVDAESDRMGEPWPMAEEQPAEMRSDESST